MKFIYTFCIAIFFMNGLTSQNVNFNWAKSVGGTGFDGATSISADALGNVYTAGYFQGIVDFNSGAGVYTLAANGGLEVFIQKTDSAGNFIWAKTFGGNYDDNIESIAVDGAGNVYSTGNFESIVDFDPGAGVYNLTASDDFDVFISKLDSSGNFLWAKCIGGIGPDLGNSLSLDASANVLVTGTFSSTTDFDPGAGVYNLSPVAQEDAFVVKLDASGNFSWARRFGGTWYDRGLSVMADAVGNVYTTGRFSGTCDFDPGAGVFNLTANSYGNFISKLDATGNFIWAKDIGGFVNDQLATVLDGSGNIYTAGNFFGTLDADPGPGIYSLTSGGNFADIAISKLDAQGNFVWAKKINGTSDKEVRSLALDALANVYITGYFWGTIVFDPPTGAYSSTMPLGSANIFVSIFDNDGNCMWATGIGSPTSEGGNDVVIDNFGGIYVTGYFRNTLDIDPGAGIYNLGTTGGYDAFVLKLNVCLQPSVPIDVTPPINKIICNNGSTVLLANGPGLLTWYASPSSTIILATGNTYTTSPLTTGTYTYYQEAYSCTNSARSAISVTVDACLGMSETNFGSEARISIYPNPFTNSVTFEFNIPVKNTELTVYNSVGQKVKTLTILSEDKIVLERGNLAAGVYYFEVGKGDIGKTGKFLISD